MAPWHRNSPLGTSAARAVTPKKALCCSGHSLRGVTHLLARGHHQKVPGVGPNTQPSRRAGPGRAGTARAVRRQRGPRRGGQRRSAELHTAEPRGRAQRSLLPRRSASAGLTSPCPCAARADWLRVTSTLSSPLLFFFFSFFFLPPHPVPEA